MQSYCFISNKSEAIDRILEADRNTSVILDFDETLLLRNSTAEYLNSLRPRLLGLILISIIKIIRPWTWLPKPFKGYKTKDWFLVIIPTLLLPWTLFLWRKKAKKIARNQGNLELIAAVNNNSNCPVIFASLGFKFIINPILQHLPLKCLESNQSYRLIGCRFWKGAKDRNMGKLLMLQQEFSDSAIASSVLVTDSEDDLPLLKVVKYPCLVVWSSAKYINPFQDFWLYSLLRKFKT